MKKLLALFLLIVFTPHIAEASNFTSVKLPRGVELQLPKGWWLLGDEINQLLEMSAEAAMDLSGIGLPEGTETNLISANSMPTSTYAAVRVDSTTPASGPPFDFANITTAELQAYQSAVHEDFKKLLPLQGNQMLSFYGVRREFISGNPSLITGYRRSGPKGPVIVSIIQVFTPSQDLRIILSYRESEQAIWKPVIGKIRQSITIRRWP